MNDDDLFPSRDELRLWFPDWFINWVLGPLPSEVGWGLFLVKQLTVSAIGWRVLDLFLSTAASDTLARSLVVTGAVSILGCLLWR
jgi:hypothetical protein